MSGVPAVRRHHDHVNYTAVRTLRALEVVAFATGTAPQLAELLGCHPRTTRRMLGTLVSERYVERVHEPRGPRYVPTVRLLALAAQLARRLSLVEHGERTVADLHATTGLTAYLAVPSYGEVLVLTRAGETAPWSWDLLLATDCAPGQVLLAYREPWRHSVASNGELELLAQVVRERGHALIAGERARVASLAVPVPEPGAPMAALALTGCTDAIAEHEPQLVHELVTAAAQLAERCPAGRIGNRGTERPGA